MKRIDLDDVQEQMVKNSSGASRSSLVEYSKACALIDIAMSLRIISEHIEDIGFSKKFEITEETDKE